jgi:hypothetical protein
LILTAIVGAILSAAIVIRTAIEPRFVVNIDHPNGTRFRVVQEFQYNGEMFDTSIYFDDGNGQWRWYYYDHDDGYWGSAETKIDGSIINVFANKRSIKFDTETGECTVTQLEGGRRNQQKSSKFRTLPPELTPNSGELNTGYN